MNISFIVILTFWILTTFYIKNLLNIDVRGFRRYAWLTISACILQVVILGINIWGIIYKLPHFLFLEVPVAFIVGPSIYLLLKNRPRRSYNHKKIDLLHFATAILFLLILAPIYTLDSNDKLKLITSVPTLVVYTNWALIVQLCIYLIALLITVKSRIRITRNDNRVYPLIGYMVYIFLIAIGFVHPDKAQAAEILGSVLLCILVIHYHRLNTGKGVAKPQTTNGNIVSQLEQLMQNEKLYLKQDLTLSQLAGSLNMKAHEISSILNKEMNINYNDYINKLRVQETIHLLQDKENDKYKIETIAKMAGFKSLTTFNTAFKKHTGKTPKEYKP